MLTSYLRVEIDLTELKLAKYPEVEKTHLKKFRKRETLRIIILYFHYKLYVSATKHLNTTTILSEHVEKALWEIFKIPENTNIHLWT